MAFLRRHMLKLEVTAVVLMLLMWAAAARGQSTEVVFQSAFERSFTVTDCSNTSPITVTVATPGASDLLTLLPFDAGTLVSISGVLGNTNCNVTDNAIGVLTAVTFTLTGVNGNAAYVSGGTGRSDTISAVNDSPVLNNLGQGGHLLNVQFPTAVGAVTPIQVRIETAFTCSDPPFCPTADWRPVSIDVVDVASLGGTFYNMTKANGTWPAVRVSRLATTPTNLPMRVDYTGMPFPIGSLVTSSDRITINNPWGGAGGAPRMTFALCLGVPCAAATNLANRWIVTGPMVFGSCYAMAKTAPTGANLIFDVNLNGTTSIFPAAASEHLQIVAATNVAPIVSDLVAAGANATVGDFYTVDIDTIGSTIEGQDVTVVCTIQ